jgi:hypothetical protein
MISARHRTRIMISDPMGGGKFKSSAPGRLNLPRPVLEIRVMMALTGTDDSVQVVGTHSTASGTRAITVTVTIIIEPEPQADWARSPGPGHSARLRLQVQVGC